MCKHKVADFRSNENKGPKSKRTHLIEAVNVCIIVCRELPVTDGKNIPINMVNVVVISA